MIFSIYYPDHRGLGVETTETTETRLFSVGPTETEAKILFNAGKATNKHFSQFQDKVISILPEEPGRILMGFDTDKPTYPSVYSVDVKTARKSIVKRARTPIRNWIADRQGRVRAGVGYDQRTGERSIWAHNLETDKWSMLWEYKYFTQPDITPLGFSIDPHILYIRVEHTIPSPKHCSLIILY